MICSPSCGVSQPEREFIEAVVRAYRNGVRLPSLINGFLSAMIVMEPETRIRIKVT